MILEPVARLKDSNLDSDPGWLVQWVFALDNSIFYACLDLVGMELGLESRS